MVEKVKDTGPLDWRIAITDKNGRPTTEFQRRWNTQRGNNALIGFITFGTGSPPTDPVPEDGAQYADTSVDPYVFYIAYEGVWNQATTTEFTQLHDVPPDYLTSSDFLVRVKSDETGLEFVDPGDLSDDPTAVAGATAIPGTADTFMRSDGAPAVSKGTAATYGIVKVDGTSILSSAGDISVPTATSVANGISRPDNTTITISGGVLTAVGSGSGGGFFTPRPPTTGQFNLSNSGTGVVTTVQAGTNCYTVTRTDANPSGGDKMGFRGKAVPAGSSWTASAILQANPSGMAAGQFFRAGLGILENSTGKSINLCMNTQGGVPTISCLYMSNLNTFGSTVGTDTTVNALPGYPIYMQIEFTGTSYIFRISYDYGVSYTTVGTAVVGSFFTADRVGLCVEVFGTGVANAARVHCVYYSDPDIP